jgi:hypothetical protein
MQGYRKYFGAFQFAIDPFFYKLNYSIIDHKSNMAEGDKLVTMG